MTDRTQELWDELQRCLRLKRLADALKQAQEQKKEDGE